MWDEIRLPAGELITVQTEVDEHEMFTTTVRGPGAEQFQTSASHFLASQNHRKSVQALKNMGGKVIHSG